MSTDPERKDVIEASENSMEESGQVLDDSEYVDASESNTENEIVMEEYSEEEVITDSENAEEDTIEVEELVEYVEDNESVSEVASVGSNVNIAKGTDRADDVVADETGQSNENDDVEGGEYKEPVPMENENNYIDETCPPADVHTAVDETFLDAASQLPSQEPVIEDEDQEHSTNESIASISTEQHNNIPAGNKKRDENCADDPVPRVPFQGPGIQNNKKRPTEAEKIRPDDAGAGAVCADPLCQATCYLMIFVIVIGIILAMVLTSDSRSRDGSLPIPTVPPDTTAPSLTPTSAPTPFSIEQTLIGNFNGPANSRYGTSVAISTSSRSFIAVGAPDAPGPGSVVILQNTTGSWQPASNLSVALAQEGSQFGAAVAFTTQNQNIGIIVGAPDVFASGTTTSTGAAYYFEYDRTEERWNQLGSRIQGGSQPENANEKFGYSVATSENYRIVVGAPLYNQVGSLRSGRVYTYERPSNPSTGFEWVEMSDQQILGSVADGQFGSAVAMSPDGNMMAAGSSINSLFTVYAWTGTDWQMIFSDVSPGGNTNEEFASSLTFLSNAHIAVGGPRAFNDAGVVRVYELSQNGLFVQVGPDITGENGERIGAARSVSGAVFDDGRPAVTVGTNSGMVRRFDYNRIMDEWVQRYEAVDTGAGATSSVAMLFNGPASTIVAGKESSDEIFIYDAFLSESVGTETTVPSLSPPVTATVSPVGVRAWSLISSLPAGGATTDSGAAVSLTANSVAYTAPGFSSDSGIVQPYERSGNNFTSLPTLFATEGSAGRFGSAVDAITTTGRTALLVGAPTSEDTQGFGVTLGSASYFELTNGVYEQLGNIIEPDAVPTTVDGRFGASVAAAQNVARIAIGAPRTNIDANLLSVGQVYTYEYDGSAWVRLETVPVLGSINGANLGFDVDMSEDGNRLLVGAPGSNTAIYYEYSEGSWQEIFSASGLSAADQFGTTVAIISSDGDTIAVGGPDFIQGSGIIRVYRRGADGAFTQLGNDIVGGAGDRLGSENMLSGSNSRLVLGTATGNLVRYDHMESLDEWQQVSVSENIGGVTSVDTTGDANVVIVGDAVGSSISIFSLEG